MSKVMTRKAWLEYLQKAVDEFDWDAAGQEQGEIVTTDVEWLARRTDAAYNAGYKEGVKDAHAKQEAIEAAHGIKGVA